MKSLVRSAFLLITLCTQLDAQSVDRLIATDATVKTLAIGFQFTEGPAVAADGSVVFSDIPNSRIHHWSTDGKISVLRENTGRANGLFYLPDGRLVACEGGNRQVTVMGKDGKIEVLANECNGKKLNSPNDLWPDKAGGIYFTDPRYGDMEGLEQPGFHVYYIDPKGRVTRIISDLVKPNGILGTADNKYLYVADPGDKKTYRYVIKRPGKLGARELFCESGSDGMTLDESGNLYLTSGAVKVYSPMGKHLGDIETPLPPANVVFGGVDRKTLYITARSSFYSLQMTVAGDN